MKVYLVIGNCGVGKTWLMRQLINHWALNIKLKINKIDYTTNGKIFILGKYDGSTFEGSDRLSMAVANDFVALKGELQSYNPTIICEGDRFMNKRFIETFNPQIIKIEGSGEEGRKIRKSSQTDRHLKAIKTRVESFKPDWTFGNSSEAFQWIKNKEQK